MGVERNDRKPGRWDHLAPEKKAGIQAIYGGRCPGCDAELPFEVIRVDRPFQCPSCGWNVRVRERSQVLHFVVTLLSSVALPYLFDVRGLAWVLTTIVLFFPAMMIVTMMMQRVLPQEFRLDDDFRLQMRRRDDSDPPAGTE